MNIVLIGYRGTGKSVVSAQLCKALNMKHLVMDQEIVKKAGMTIPEFVDQFGWDKFRDFETQVALKAADMDNAVIDTGGGVIERPENIPALKKNSIVVWLKASAGVIVKRIQSDTDRPALTRDKSFTEEVTEVLLKRLPKYSDAADHEIETDNLTPEQITDEIIKILGNDSGR